jgi:hypothetical protein
VRGQTTWLGISAGVRAGPRQFAGKAELTRQSHGPARAVERTRGRERARARTLASGVHLSGNAGYAAWLG